jgi:hypothetical protein
MDNPASREGRPEVQAPQLPAPELPPTANPPFTRPTEFRPDRQKPSPDPAVDGLARAIRPVSRAIQPTVEFVRPAAKGPSLSPASTAGADPQFVRPHRRIPPNSENLAANEIVSDAPRADAIGTSPPQTVNEHTADPPPEPASRQDEVPATPAAAPYAAETGGGAGPPPPPGNSPSFMDEPEDEPSAAARADSLFDARTVTPPSAEELEQLRQKEPSINWLGYVTTRSPVSVAFGDRNHAAESERSFTSLAGEAGVVSELPERLRPDRPDEIVERQLASYSDTLTRIHEGAAAAKDLNELTARHEGRAVADRSELGFRSGYPTVSFLDRFKISLTRPEGHEEQEMRFGVPTPQLATPENLDVQATRPLRDDPSELLRHDTPDGEVHLVQRDSIFRFRIRVEDGQVVQEQEHIFEVKPDDPEYFGRLGEDLSAYEGTLLKVAERAGFSRDRIINPESGQFDRDYLLEQVDPVIARPEFQQSLPQDLRAELMRQTHSIAQRVNPMYYGPHNIVERGWRLGGYFRAALGRRDS